jgi:hypothetical protein
VNQNGNEAESIAGNFVLAEERQQFFEVPLRAVGPGIPGEWDIVVLGAMLVTITMTDFTCSPHSNGHRLVLARMDRIRWRQKRRLQSHSRKAFRLKQKRLLGGENVPKHMVA